MNVSDALDLLEQQIAEIPGLQLVDPNASDAADFLANVPGRIARLPMAPDPAGRVLREFIHLATSLYDQRDALLNTAEPILIELILSVKTTVQRETTWPRLKDYLDQGTNYLTAILDSMVLCYELLQYIVRQRAGPKSMLEQLREVMVDLQLDYDGRVFDPETATVNGYDIEALFDREEATYSGALQLIMRQVRRVADALGRHPRPTATEVNLLLAQVFIALNNSRGQLYWQGVGEDPPEAEALYLLYHMADDLAAPSDEEEEEEHDEHDLPVVVIPEEQEDHTISPDRIRAHRLEERVAISADVTFLLLASSQHVTGTLDDVWMAMDKIRPARGLHPSVLLVAERHDARYAVRSTVWPVALAHLASAARVESWKREFGEQDWAAVCRALVPLFLWCRHVALWVVADACSRASVRWSPIDGGRGIIVDALASATDPVPHDAPLARDGMLVALPDGRVRSDEDNDTAFLGPSARHGTYAINVPLFPQAGADLRQGTYPLVAEADGRMPAVILDPQQRNTSPVLFLAADGDRTTRVWRIASCPSLLAVWRLLEARVTDALPNDNEEKEEDGGPWEVRFLAWLLDGRTGNDPGLRALMPLRADVLAFAASMCSDAPLPVTMVTAVRQNGLRALLPPATRTAYYFLSRDDT